MGLAASVAAAMATCYRHPSRETNVSCSNCGRPICTDCMTTTSVGMRCPECAREKTQVRTLRTMASEPRVTYALIAACVILFLGSGSFSVDAAGGSLSDRLALNANVDARDQYYRLITGGFLHAGLLHILFNMYLLYLLGTMLEPVMGSVRFAVLYFVSLLCGSFGALVQTSFDTVGASGAVFGLMGAAAIELRSRGIDPLRSDIGALILFNLVFSFVLSNVSIGGHIGGLIGGTLAALAFDAADRRGVRWAGYAACAVLAAIAVVGAVTVALPVHDHSI
jgi:membrane associated rhomboid family serine protease